MGISSSCVVCWPSYLTWTITSFVFLPLSLNKFWQENYASMGGHYGFRIVGIFLGPLRETSGSTTNILWWYRFSLYRGLCPIHFLGRWVLMAPYLCFCIFNRPVLEKYVFLSWWAPTLVLIMLTCNARWFSSFSYGNAPFFWKSGNY